VPRVPLDSSSLAWAQYDPALRRLEVEFRNGERYLYFQVPPHLYQNLLDADSKGAFFNRRIRNCFAFKQLTRPRRPIVLAAPGKTK
jgi:KTSC domain